MCSIEYCRFRWPWVTPNTSFKANISQTVHPIHSMFGSRLGFWGVGGSNDAISGWIKSKMAADGHNFATGLPMEIGNLVLAWGLFRPSLDFYHGRSYTHCCRAQPLRQLGCLLPPPWRYAGLLVRYARYDFSKKRKSHFNEIWLKFHYQNRDIDHLDIVIG